MNAPIRFDEKSFDCEKRHQPREPIVLRARASNRASAKFNIHVLDISATGLRADADDGVSVHDTIWLTVPGFLSLEATVAWRRKEIIGCNFRTPLDPPMLAWILNGAKN